MPFFAQTLAQAVGLPVNQIRLVLSQLYAIVLCFVLRSIK